MNYQQSGWGDRCTGVEEPTPQRGIPTQWTTDFASQLCSDDQPKQTALWFGETSPEMGGAAYWNVGSIALMRGETGDSGGTRFRISAKVRLAETGSSRARSST